MFTTTLLAIALVAPPEVPAPDVRDAVKNGLKWLAEKQNKDGTWSGNGTLTVNVTAYAGLALLMEGSTLKEGPYSANLRRAVAWFEKIAQPDGRLVPADDVSERGRYMQSQAAALLFLASAHDTDDDETRRERLGKVLDKAVRFAIDGQTKRGGWGFVSATPGSENDDTQSTAFMIQSLLVAEKAGAKVPREVIDKAIQYLTKATTASGGVSYTITGPGSLAVGQGQGLQTAAAAAAVASSGRKIAPLPKWISYSKRDLPRLEQPGVPPRAALNPSTLQQHLAAARVALALGETGHGALDPDAREADQFRWSPYREQLYKALKSTQLTDGSWSDSGRGIGPVYATSLALIILQLDNNYLPAFSK